ncbi:hypothetical protein BDP27DRAFT_465380 [Rhodocollybia butyracea]|uniref:DUF6697 domain-containing protein n=1 Tax=Rhodocollybia butyracea TaxID=206335 RepID=A0A9P5PA57_9AGAR|nr:hypothetical protein BDP27DRAFT_465380 [Rhodocollybia butyracea]
MEGPKLEREPVGIEPRADYDTHKLPKDEHQLPEKDFKIQQLEFELKEAKSKLDKANAEIARLKTQNRVVANNRSTPATSRRYSRFLAKSEDIVMISDEEGEEDSLGRGTSQGTIVGRNRSDSVGSSDLEISEPITITERARKRRKISSDSFSPLTPVAATELGTTFCTATSNLDSGAPKLSNNSDTLGKSDICDTPFSSRVELNPRSVDKPTVSSTSPTVSKSELKLDTKFESDSTFFQSSFSAATVLPRNNLSHLLFTFKADSEAKPPVLSNASSKPIIQSFVNDSLATKCPVAAASTATACPAIIFPPPAPSSNSSLKIDTKVCSLKDIEMHDGTLEMKVNTAKNEHAIQTGHSTSNVVYVKDEEKPPTGPGQKAKVKGAPRAPRTSAALPASDPQWKATVDGLLQNTAALDIQPKPDMNFQIQRRFLNHHYDCNTGSFLAVMKPAYNPSSTPNNPRPRPILFPFYEENPDLPAHPGAPGIILTAREDILEIQPVSIFINYAGRGHSLVYGSTVGTTSWRTVR